MPGEIIAAARRIRGEVRISEDGFDLALASTARLAATMLDTRRETGLPGGTGRETVKRLMEVLAHGAEAREMLLDVHQDLAAMNLRELATGDLLECPDIAESGSLSLVGGRDHQRS